MRYLHTMIRAANLEQTLHFFVDQLGLIEAYRYENEAGRFTLVFLSAPADVDNAKSLITGTQKPTMAVGILATWRIKSTIFITLANS